MKYLVPILLLTISSGCYSTYSRAILRLEIASDETERFYALENAAQESFNKGKIKLARSYALEELELASKFKNNWHYGNAIHSAHMVLGRIELKEGNTSKAIEHLFLAAKTPGSPQLDSFGPNLSLANDLLQIGELDAVIEYLELTISFWADEDDPVHKRNLSKIRNWQKQIRKGDIPDFGPNLRY